ncbi:hypothetical protein [Kitasatospora cinereorecta]|uniref:CopC domain-containing protein n=1 Tax=Kitasatospora cinereorecta TaxID=285560 RepID=A0ABW0VBV9_9ACTN
MHHPSTHLRRLAGGLVTGLLTAMLALGAAAPAGAHGDTIALTVTGTEAGHPVLTAVWENDRDPVTDPIGGTLSATAADGTAIGPLPLVAVPGRPGTVTTARALTPGHWQVTAETAFPGLGRYEGVLDVPVTDPPVSTAGPAVPTTVPTSTVTATTAATAATTATTASSAPTPVPVAARPRSHGWPLLVGVLAVTALGVSAVAAGVVVLRRSAGS